MMHPYTKAMKTEFGKTGRPDSEFETFLNEKRNTKNWTQIQPGRFVDLDNIRYYKDVFGRMWEQPEGCGFPYVSTVIVEKFNGNGVYLVKFNENCSRFVRCEKIGEHIHMTFDLEPGPKNIVSLDWFNNNVRGEVFAVAWKHSI